MIGPFEHQFITSSGFCFNINFWSCCQKKKEKEEKGNKYEVMPSIGLTIAPENPY
jgi:hypothetical protein